MSWLFASGGQSVGASASVSVLPINIQGWFPIGLTGLISLLSQGPSGVFSFWAEDLSKSDQYKMQECQETLSSLHPDMGQLVA